MYLPFEIFVACGNGHDAIALFLITHDDCTHIKPNDTFNGSDFYYVSWLCFTLLNFSHPTCDLLIGNRVRRGLQTWLITDYEILHMLLQKYKSVFYSPLTIKNRKGFELGHTGKSLISVDYTLFLLF